MRSQLSLALLLCAAFALCACGPAEYPLAGTSRAAGTDGKVTVTEIEGNSLFKIELEFLPPPSRVGNGLQHYVLWIQGQNQQPQREGVLEYDEDDRTARATATAPRGAVTLIISAERTATPQSPSDVVVARRQIPAQD